jgi:hypothetical protein
MEMFLMNLFFFISFLFLETQTMNGAISLNRINGIELAPPFEQEGVTNELEPRCHWHIYLLSLMV